MKTITKEKYRDIELGELNRILCFDSKKIPLVNLNGGMRAETGFNSVKTASELCDKPLDFVLITDIFDFENPSDDWKEPYMKSYESQFINQYVNRLRLISYLPEDILSEVKDKRMLALGYAEEEVKSAIAKFTKDRCDRAWAEWERDVKRSEKAERQLSVCGQFKRGFPFAQSINSLFTENYIERFYKSGGRIFISDEMGETAVLEDACAIEEECDPNGAFICAYELYNTANGYELHFLLSKKDENFVDRFYYATYFFKDMRLEEELAE